MNPAFSVVFLTTLIGAGQGLFLAMYSAEVAASLRLTTTRPDESFLIAGSGLALLLTAGGLLASFFHLGHPERAWRSAAKWRTSWLSREVIMLPAFMGAVLAYGAGHYAGSPTTLAAGAVATLLCVALFACTAMIYACIRFLQEWSSPLTLANFLLLGCASGTTLAAAVAAFTSPGLADEYAMAAIALTVLGFTTRCASLVRNARLKPRSTLRTAIGISHPRIAQKSQGFMGSSFNTREFFHGQTQAFLRSIKWTFLALAFAVPVLLLAAGIAAGSPAMLCAAFAMQYTGLLAERWFFLAQANHPQNLYYQVIS